MRKLIVGAFVSLDGVMQAPGGPDEDRSGGFEYGGWTFPHGDDTTMAFVSGHFEHPFSLVLGRRTYDIFAGYWPNQDPTGPVADPFGKATKYVVSNGEPNLGLDRS